MSGSSLRSTAGKMGCYLITETMARRHELALASHDRLFPNQDPLPRGFGNLIALPLQHGATMRLVAAVGRHAEHECPTTKDLSLWDKLGDPFWPTKHIDRPDRDPVFLGQQTRTRSSRACDIAGGVAAGRLSRVGSGRPRANDWEEPWTRSVATEHREITGAGGSFSLRRVCPSRWSVRLERVRPPT